jgi:hypothetical protein
MKRLAPYLVPVIVLVLTGVAAACPMCKDSIPNSDAQSAGGLPSGFNQSVYLMLVSFLSVLGLMVGIIWKGVKSTGISTRGFPVQSQTIDPK